jgi:hypothetical protein
MGQECCADKVDPLFGTSIPWKDTACLTMFHIGRILVQLAGGRRAKPVESILLALAVATAAADSERQAGSIKLR